MHPGVGSARADEVDAVTAEIRDGAGELAGNRSLSRLTREAVETRTVIGHEHPYADGAFRWAVQITAAPLSPAPVAPRSPAAAVGSVQVAVPSDQTNSMRAMGAASPCRGPSFKIRV